ncbi:MAG: hypothetical protein P4L64_12520 [Caulobacteraceae bacterium]|nr:hypothetical protein [Caulobacteraceae bacterium]
MHRKLASVGLYALALVFVTCVGNRAFGQECPRFNATGPTIVSQVRTLEGRLIYHDGLRQWFELKLDRPQCGQSSIQLMQIKLKSKDLEFLRGCRVRSSGAIDLSPTGYYSLDTFQDVERVTSVGRCLRKAPLPQYPDEKPDALIRAYTVSMRVNYRAGDHPIIINVRSGGRALRPWRAYASYMLTGGFVLYGSCGEGFVIDKVFGTPQAHPGHFDDPRTSGDMATFDPESAAASGRWDLRLGYTCVRAPVQEP